MIKIDKNGVLRDDLGRFTGWPGSATGGFQLEPEPEDESVGNCPDLCDCTCGCSSIGCACTVQSKCGCVCACADELAWKAGDKITTTRKKYTTPFPSPTVGHGPNFGKGYDQELRAHQNQAEFANEPPDAWHNLSKRDPRKAQFLAYWNYRKMKLQERRSVFPELRDNPLNKDKDPKPNEIRFYERMVIAWEQEIEIRNPPAHDEYDEPPATNDFKWITNHMLMCEIKRSDSRDRVGNLFTAIRNKLAGQDVNFEKIDSVIVDIGDDILDQEFALAMSKFNQKKQIPKSKGGEPEVTVHDLKRMWIAHKDGLTQIEML